MIALTAILYMPLGPFEEQARRSRRTSAVLFRTQRNSPSTSEGEATRAPVHSRASDPRMAASFSPGAQK